MEAVGMKTVEHFVDSLGSARDQQAATRLRIRQKRLLHGAVAGQVDEACTAKPVTSGGSSDVPGRHQLTSLGEQGDAVPAHRRSYSGAAAHFQQMAQQPETRDV